MSASASDKRPKGLNKRSFVQLVCAVLCNFNLTGFAKGTIYQGPLKGLCAPGLNCYSCPGAMLACPIGALSTALTQSQYKVPYYVLGTLLLFGVLFGRMICGFLCPFGLLQELLYKIPIPKVKKNGISRVLTWVKYVILAVFVVLVPLMYGFPAFCEFICPAGTLEAGIPLVAASQNLRDLVGSLYLWKMSVLVIVVCAITVLYRGFCRFLCPLGALYSFFNRTSVFGVSVDPDVCDGCGACVQYCKMDVLKVGDRECIQCGDCRSVCPHQAIHLGKKSQTKITTPKITTL